MLCLLPTTLVIADESPFNLMAVDNFIIPGYRSMAESTNALHQAAEIFCQQPEESGLSMLHSRFHTAMDSWQRIQAIQIGPIEKRMRTFRIQFWPDKRGSVSRHLTSMLNKAEPALLEQQRFTNGSVAVQGFSALERLLFPLGTVAGKFSASPEGDFRCRLVESITENLSIISSSILDEWQTGKSSHRQLIATAAQGNARYNDSSEVSARLLNNLFTQLERIIEQKIRRPLGKDEKHSRGKRAESWRSGRSLRNIALNLEGIEQLYQHAFFSRLSHPEITTSIHHTMVESKAILSKIEIPLKDAVADPTTRKQLVLLAESIELLKYQVIGKLAAELDIPIGFNSLDGD